MSHLWECVHGPLHGVARESVHGVEGVGHQLGPLRQGGEHRSLLGLKAFVRFLSRLGRVHNHVHACLSGWVGNKCANISLGKKSWHALLGYVGKQFLDVSTFIPVYGKLW